MRILFLTNNPNLGSTARILQSWLLLGKEQGLIGYVVTQRSGDFSRWLEEHQVPHRIDPMPWPSRQWPVPSLWHAWRVARWARRNRIDVLHCNEHDVYPFAVLLRRLLRLPLVCHVRYRIERPFCEWAFGARRRPDALLWTSRRQQDDCSAAVEGLVPADDQHIVSLGIDLAAFGKLVSTREDTRRAWGIHPDEIVIGTASALRPRKRIEDFIDLVVHLAHEDERVVGVLAGDAVPSDEGYRDQLLRQVRDAGLGRRFRWLGNLEPIEPFYHGIDLFVSASEYETFGNSVCEAMACARPVVGYAGGSVQEVVGAAGLIVETGDLPALTDAVRRCVRSPMTRVSLGQHGRARVAERFNPVHSLRMVRQLHETLATRSHQPSLGRYPRLQR
jgi:glycosyltransferase involved in cell wall biosynthesis